MGALLDVPKTDKHSESGEGLGLKYGLSCMQGWRVEMEDAHCANIGLPFGLDKWSFFAVFDGHAGLNASEYCASNLLETILQDKYFNKILENETLKVGEGSCGEQEQQQEKQPQDDKPDAEKEQQQDKPDEQEDISNVKQAEKPIEEELISSSAASSTPSSTNDDLKNSKTLSAKEVKKNDKIQRTVQLDKIKEAIRLGFLNVDEKLREVETQDKSGTTAVCAFISPTYIFIANCGDSRAVISRRGKQQNFSTEDHKPVNPKERERIINAGGTVIIQRVNGSLAVSRALGDFDYKQVSGMGPCEQLISPEPEINCLTRSDIDEFIILACDGIWDVMTNDEICEFIRYKLRVEDDLEAICASVIDVCLYRGSRDNMSIIIVVLEGAQTKTAEAVHQEKEDEKKICESALAFLKLQPDQSVHELIVHCNQRNIELSQIPVGAGIESKREFLLEVMNSFHNNKN